MDLVVLSEVRWSYFRTRKQFLLSRFPNRWRIFFAQPPGSGDDAWTPVREGNVTAFTVPFLKPGTKSALYNVIASTPAGRSAIERAAEFWLRRSLRRLDVERDPVFLVSNVFASGVLPRLSKKLVVYDFNDSPFQFSSSPDWARDYWSRTLRQVDLVFVVSEYYRRQLAQETDRPLVLLGNGVESEHFERSRPVPSDLASLPRPLIGYVGLLSHFLDFDVLEALRRRRRGGTIVLIGPGSPATDAAVGALAARDGVALLGPRPYADVPAYMQALDVGVIPFRANDPHVRGINPNKVYQYLASGLPVITTPVLDLVQRPPDLQFASSSDSFGAALDRALDEPADRERRRAMARVHDWGALAARMVSEIESRLPAAS